MKFGMQVGLGPGDFVLDGDPAPPPQKGGGALQIFGPCLLWPNGWMDEAGNWHGGRSQPRRLCVRWGPSPPPQIFGPCLWPTGWMDQDATWHEGRPQPKRLLDWAPAPSIFGPFLLWPNDWMHQDATWYGGRPQPRRLCVRWGPSPYPKRGAAPPNFRSTSIVAKRLHGSRCTWYGGRPQPTRHCVRCGPSYPQKNGHIHPTQFLAHVYCHIVAKWLDG